jgi:hypothetical protein
MTAKAATIALDRIDNLPRFCRGFCDEKIPTESAEHMVFRTRPFVSTRTSGRIPHGIDSTRNAAALSRFTSGRVTRRP